jgi:hypothetical protein
MALVRYFSELRVYQQAFEAASHIYKLSKRWPTEERYTPHTPMPPYSETDEA